MKSIWQQEWNLWIKWQKTKNSTDRLFLFYAIESVFCVEHFRAWLSHPRITKFFKSSMFLRLCTKSVNPPIFQKSCHVFNFTPLHNFLWRRLDSMTLIFDDFEYFKNYLVTFREHSIFKKFSWIWIFLNSFERYYISIYYCKLRFCLTELPINWMLSIQI